MINEKLLNKNIKVIEKTFSVDFRSTGWRTGNFQPDVIPGYKLVAIQSRRIPSGDLNAIIYNYYDDMNWLFWVAIVNYPAGIADARAYFIYAKEDLIS